MCRRELAHDLDRIDVGIAGEGEAFEITVRVARNVEVVRRARSAAAPAPWVWRLAAARFTSTTLDSIETPAF
jgi:hypothetical protein